MFTTIVLALVPRVLAGAAVDFCAAADEVTAKTAAALARPKTASTATQRTTGLPPLPRFLFISILSSRRRSAAVASAGVVSFSGRSSIPTHRQLHVKDLFVAALACGVKKL
jgi:hypothetical protein